MPASEADEALSSSDQSDSSTEEGNAPAADTDEVLSSSSQKGDLAEKQEHEQTQ